MGKIKMGSVIENKFNKKLRNMKHGEIFRRSDFSEDCVFIRQDYSYGKDAIFMTEIFSGIVYDSPGNTNEMVCPLSAKILLTEDYKH